MNVRYSPYMQTPPSLTGEADPDLQGWGAGTEGTERPKELPQRGHGGKSKLKEVLEGAGISQAGQAFDELSSNPVSVQPRPRGAQRLLGPRPGSWIARWSLWVCKGTRIPGEAIPVQWGRKLRGLASSDVKVKPPQRGAS